MAERVKRIKDFLNDVFEGRQPQIFTTKNIVGDFLVPIYEEDEVEIEYCPKWNYVEIFGLSEEEEKEL